MFNMELLLSLALLARTNNPSATSNSHDGQTDPVMAFQHFAEQLYKDEPGN